MNEHYEDELRQFRLDAAKLALEPTDDEIAELETAGAFIDRMRASEISARHRPRRGWWLASVAAISAAVIALATLQQASRPATAKTPPSLDYEFASAVRIAYAPGEPPDEMLHLLASTASAADPITRAHGLQYKQTDNWFTEGNDRGATPRIIPRVSETWLHQNGAWTTRESTGTPLSPDGRGLKRSDNPTDATIDYLPPGSVDPDYEKSLPTDPERLADAMLDHSDCVNRQPGTTRSSCLYREVTSLFQTYVVRPKLAGAIWTMLGDEKGFTTLGSVTDRADREGVGISLLDPAQPQFRFILIGSLDDGQLLGFEEILVKDMPGAGIKAPSVYAFVTIIQSKYESDRPPTG